MELRTNRSMMLLAAAAAVALLAAAALLVAPGEEARGAENGPGVAFFATVQNTDVAAAGVGGMRGNGTGSIELTGVSGSVRRALLYWHGPTNSQSSAANAVVRFGGTPVTGTHIGFANDNCWEFANSQAYRADVTALVAGNGTYALTEFRKAEGAQVVADVNGASLIVFFDDGNAANNRDVVVFDGNDSNLASPDEPQGWSVSLAGIDYSSGEASLRLHVADGQSFEDDALHVNGEEIVPRGPIFQGDSVPSPPEAAPDLRLWDIEGFDVTRFLSPGENTLALTTGPPGLGDCLSLVVAAIDLPAGAAPAAADVQLVAKVDEPDPVAVERELRYTLTARNNGPDGAFGVTLSDSLPASVVPVSAAASQGSCSLAQTVSCAIGFLASGASASVTIVVRPTSAGTVTNTATVSAATDDPDGGNNSATATTAVFVPRYALTVAKAGEGSGVVASQPPGIDCGVDCSEEYDEKTSVTLTATAASGSRFSGWSGACSGDGSCVVSMNAAHTVTAMFEVVRTPGGTVPRPTPGRTGNVRPVRGVVLVREPGTTAFVPLTGTEQIPVGSQLDTRRGRVRLTTALPGGRLQTADFYEGLFTFFQRARDRFVVELRLDGGNFRRCPQRTRTASADAAKPPKRRVWGSGKGKYRTRGRYSSATIRGTIWLTEDRCDGTLTRVRTGSVTVRDFVRRRTVVVRSGRSYLARRP